MDGSASTKHPEEERTNRIEQVDGEGELDGVRPESGEEEEEGVLTKREREAFIACTRRKQETLNTFLEEVTHQGLHYTLAFQASLNTDTSLFLYDESYKPVKIYRIFLPTS